MRERERERQSVRLRGIWSTRQQRSNCFFFHFFVSTLHSPVRSIWQRETCARQIQTLNIGSRRTSSRATENLTIYGSVFAGFRKRQLFYGVKLKTLQSVRSRFGPLQVFERQCRSLELFLSVMVSNYEATWTHQWRTSLWKSGSLDLQKIFSYFWHILYVKLPPAQIQLSISHGDMNSHQSNLFSFPSLLLIPSAAPLYLEQRESIPQP